MLRVSVILLLVMATPLASASWLQPGYDAARTSFTPEDGPVWNDVVYSIRLPVAQGPRAWAQPMPVVVGDKVYVAGETDDYLPTIFEVDLKTSQWRPFAEPPGQNALGEDIQYARVKSMAADAERLYAVRAYGYVDAWSLADGAPAWNLSLRPATEPLTTRGVVHCLGGELAVLDDAVLVACDLGERDFGVLEIESATGDVRWSYRLSEDAGWSARDASIPDPADPELRTAPFRSEASEYYVPTGLSVLDDKIVVALQTLSIGDTAQDYVSRSQGLVNPRVVSTDGSMYVALVAGPGGNGDRLAWVEPDDVNIWSTATNWAPAATGGSGVAYLEMGTLWQRPLDGASGDESTSVPMRAASRDGDPASGLALAPEGLYATSLTTLHLFDHDLALLKSYELPAGQQWGRGGPVRTGNGLVIASYGPIDGTNRAWLADHGGIIALESRTLRPVWELPGAVNCTFAVSDGLVVRWCADGVLHVIGRSEASIPVAAAVSSIYPATGDVLRVDMGATGPGVLGPATEFRAVWGDGRETEWQESPLFQHQFTLPEDAPARFYARNENQTSSQAVLFHVGQDDPAMNILNSPFADQYQETSFFLLGLLITAVVAALGIARAGRKRRRLHKELRQLEADYDRLNADAHACDHMLTQRKARARSLFLERRLEEAHSSFLTGRIDELRRNLRLGAVDTRLKFLPYGMVLHLQRLLADARVDEYERDHFVAALEDETSLTATQKTEVARVIESWFLRDEGARS